MPAKQLNTMAIFSDSEFDNLALPIREKDLHKHPTTKHIFGSITASEVPVIKYVALLYDVKSPMRLKIPDVDMRKEECAEMSELKDGKEDIFNLSNDKILGYINSYLKFQSSKVWAVLTANEEVLWQYQQELLTPIKDFKNDKDKLQALDMKSKLMNECDSIIRRIESYEEKLFGDNHQEKDKIINYTPETIANI
jgi:hypothetical protein